MEGEVPMEIARKLLQAGKCRLAWIGREPLDYVASLIGVDESMMVQLSPQELQGSTTERLKELEGTVFMCYHGVSSMRVVRFLEGKGVRAYSLAGGITSIVGEIF